MSWPLRYHPARPTSAKVGDCWPEPHRVEDDAQSRVSILSRKYFERHAARRAPLVVMLPGGVEWCVDTLAINESGPHGEGWDVSGDPPNITVNPSINFGGVYHGWIRDGVITDDCEGRRFDAEGFPP